MTTFSELVSYTISDLRQGGFGKDADELRIFADLALDETLCADMRNNALTQILMRCHVKWLGDLYLANLLHNDWWRRLERLRMSTEKYILSI